MTFLYSFEIFLISRCEIPSPMWKEIIFTWIICQSFKHPGPQNTHEKKVLGNWTSGVAKTDLRPILQDIFSRSGSSRNGSTAQTATKCTKSFNAQEDLHQAHNQSSCQGQSNLQVVLHLQFYSVAHDEVGFFKVDSVALRPKYRWTVTSMSARTQPLLLLDLFFSHQGNMWTLHIPALWDDQLHCKHRICNQALFSIPFQCDCGLRVYHFSFNQLLTVAIAVR